MLIIRKLNVLIHYKGVTVFPDTSADFGDYSVIVIARCFYQILRIFVVVELQLVPTLYSMDDKDELPHLLMRYSRLETCMLRMI